MSLGFICYYWTVKDGFIKECEFMWINYLLSNFQMLDYKTHYTTTNKKKKKN